MSGNNNTNAPGFYGTKGSSSTLNYPGARNFAVSWIDSTGSLWLFGGFGIDSVGNGGKLIETQLFFILFQII
jgi:hypothetical protein